MQWYFIFYFHWNEYCHFSVGCLTRRAISAHTTYTCSPRRIVSARDLYVVFFIGTASPLKIYRIDCSIYLYIVGGYDWPMQSSVLLDWERQDKLSLYRSLRKETKFFHLIFDRSKSSKPYVPPTRYALCSFALCLSLWIVIPKAQYRNTQAFRTLGDVMNRSCIGSKQYTVYTYTQFNYYS